MKKKLRKEGLSMDEIKKAVQDIAKALENNESVEKVIVKIEIKKQKSSKAKEVK